MAVEREKVAPRGLEGVIATTTAICSVSDNFREAEYAKALRLTAKLPTMLATYIRRRRGEQPVPPDPTLGHAANFAKMAGLDHPRAAEILNTCFILQAEHGLNASTFAARIAAGTNADMHAAE